MPSIFIEVSKTPFGELILGSFEGSLCLCDWKYRKMREAIDQRVMKGLGAAFEDCVDDTIDRAKSELSEYFAGERKIFTVPLLMVGSDFQKSVWDALLDIPYGKTNSYLSLSKKLGNPDAIRAVASANGANALSVFVPCHRIIGANGDLTGYAGGVNTKRRLLKLEGALAQQSLDFWPNL